MIAPIRADCAVQLNRKNHSNESRTEAADDHTFDDFIPDELSEPNPDYSDDDMSIVGSFFRGDQLPIPSYGDNKPALDTINPLELALFVFDSFGFDTYCPSLVARNLFFLILHGKDNF